MKLNELLGIKKYHQHTIDELLDAFTTESGYKFLNRGTMGYTFKHPSKNEVLKIWMKDSAYEHYVEFVSRWKNKHVPKFFTKVKELHMFHKRSDILPETMKYVRLEYLEDAEVYKLDNIQYTAKQLSDDLSLYYTGNDILEDIEDYYEKLDTKVGWELRFFAQTAMSVIYEMNDFGAQDDFCDRNIMSRNGVPVIIDPGGFGEELSMAKVIDKITADEENISGRIKNSSYYQAMDKLPQK